MLAVLLLVGLLPLGLAGVLLSRRSAEELRATEGRYQAQLVQDKARQIELYGQRYRDVVSGVARAFEIAGGIRVLSDAGYDVRLQKTLQDDPNLIALAICPIRGEIHRAFQPDLIKREEFDQRVSEVLAHMIGRGVIVGRPQIIRSGQEMGLTIAASVMNGNDVVAAVVAVVSFQEVFKAVQQSSSKSARELLDSHGAARTLNEEKKSSCVTRSAMRRSKAGSTPESAARAPSWATPAWSWRRSRWSAMATLGQCWVRMRRLSSIRIRYSE